MYVLVSSQGVPLLVKYDSTISYLPVFHTDSEAIEASCNLVKSASPAVQKTGDAYYVRLFEWELFKDWQLKMDKQNIMLFMYPMSPKDYGAKS